MKLLILALSCSLSLLLTLNAGLLVMLSLTKLGHNTGLYALSLETTKRIVESLILFNSNFCHLNSPPFALQRDKISKFLLDYYNLFLHFCQYKFSKKFEKI